MNTQLPSGCYVHLNKCSLMPYEGVIHTPLGVKHVGKTDDIRKVGSMLKYRNNS